MADKSQTIQLLGAFAPHTGQGIGVPHACKTRETVLAFLQNHVLPRYSAQGKIYLVWDNFSATKRLSIYGSPNQKISNSHGRQRMPHG
jgi:hypothetical protein